MREDAPGKGSGERCELLSMGSGVMSLPLIDFITFRRHFELLVKSELIMGDLISRGFFVYRDMWKVHF
jgi:hypothetical protein